MLNQFFQNLAKLVVQYSVGVKKGDRISIEGPALAKDLFQALYLEVIKAGGHPLLFPVIEGTQEIKLKYGSEEQLEYLDSLLIEMIKNFDGMISISGEYNTHKFSTIDPQKIMKNQGSPARREMMQIFMERMSNKELKWIGVPYPCNALAQEANMDLFSYSEFVSKALKLDKEDPISEWKQVEERHEEIIKVLEKVDKFHIIGEDTDLTLSAKGRKWVNCCGHLNLPDGEVFTGPLEDSTNGHIRFTFPGIYQGQEIENIYLEFKDGKVVKATADKGEDLLQQVLGIENADRLGEFAIGTNYGITSFTKNMLFDEKMGGTLHCALGMGIPESGSINASAIHWDILKDMKAPDSKILADEKVIYEEGEWKI